MERNPLIDATTRSNGDRVTTLEAAVLQRYGNAAEEVDACLCLPVSYDKDLLRVIPDEIIEKDYGCGDPSRYIRAAKPFSIWAPAAAKLATSFLRLSVLAAK